LRVVFTISISGKTLPIALIQAFDVVQGSTASLKQKDKDLQLIRIKQKHKNTTEFILARSIIWGAVIFPSFDTKDHSVVFNLLDTDMFIRCSDILSM